MNAAFDVTLGATMIGSASSLSFEQISGIGNPGRPATLPVYPLRW